MTIIRNTSESTDGSIGTDEIRLVDDTTKNLNNTVLGNTRMKYVSTRSGDKEYSFTEAFLNSYADDGGLMCPKVIPRLSEETLERWSVGHSFS